MAKTIKITPGWGESIKEIGRELMEYARQEQQQMVGDRRNEKEN